jgi:hypothetical protein
MTIGPGRSTKHLEEEIKQKSRRPIKFADEQSLGMMKKTRAKGWRSVASEATHRPLRGLVLAIGLLAFIVAVGYFASL